ncbi:MAG: DUF5654 family protein [Patescibacteria group bacterium]|nr:hypothetical protein [Patescibacteria group bacterium]MBU1876766.1 hypothetical protein [Patescibacteria group bacterium]
MTDIKDKIKNGGDKIRKEIQQKTFGYILTAFGFVAALAWNDAIKSLIEYFFPLNKNTVLLKFLYAFLITFIVVIVSVYSTKLLSDKNKKNNK